MARKVAWALTQTSPAETLSDSTRSKATPKNLPMCPSEVFCARRIDDLHSKDIIGHKAVFSGIAD